MTARIAVIGAGASGLIAAYRLGQLGHEVTVFEAADAPGGLAASLEVRGARVDRYYHFICPPDEAYLALIEELGLTERLHWAHGGMGVWYAGGRHAFGTPWSLLSFSPLPVADRLRFGFAALRARRRHSWQDLDGRTAREWLIAEQGERCYDVLWRPLLEMKFGDSASEVSAAWMWARINRVARSRRWALGRERLGYLAGGTQTLIDALLSALADAGGTLRLGAPVESVLLDGGRVRGVRVAGRDEPFEIVVSTIAPPLLAGIAPGLPAGYAAELRSIEYAGVICPLIVARVPLGPDFWLNVNDPRIPFPGVITYTQLDPMPQLGGMHVHYVPVYLGAEDERWSAAPGAVAEAAVGELERIQPGFGRDVVGVFEHRDRWAQPLYPADFGVRHAALLQPETPIAGLYRADMSQVYPHDRSIVNAAECASRLARAVAARTDVPCDGSI